MLGFFISPEKKCSLKWLKKIGGKKMAEKPLSLEDMDMLFPNKDKAEKAIIFALIGDVPLIRFYSSEMGEVTLKTQ